MEQAEAPEPRPMGRPTKLTPELAERFCSLIAEGWFIEHAGPEVGVTGKTIHEWLRRAEEPDAEALHQDFRVSFERARAAAERAVWERIKLKSEGNSRDYNPSDWKADMEWLKIANPKLYREAKAIEVTGKDGGAVQVEGLAGLLALAHDDP